MAGRASDTRQRMLDSAASLLSREGTSGTTVEAVLSDAGAPRGSVYHHFPGGRGELVVEAVRQSGDRIGTVVADAVAAGDPRQALAQLGRFWRRVLVASDFRAGCPVVAVAVGGGEQVPGAVDAVAGAFTEWHTALVAMLESHGRTPAEARRQSHLVVAAVEGALVLCRVQHSTQPLDDVLAELSGLLTEPAERLG